MGKVRKLYKIDMHPQRDEILKDIVEGLPDKRIAEKWGMARTTVIRYKKNPDVIREQRRIVDEGYQKLVDGLAKRLIDKVQDIDAIHDGLKSMILDEDNKLNLVAGEDPRRMKGVFETIKILMKAQEVFAGHLMRLEQLGYSVAQSKTKDIENQTNELITVILEALEPFQEAKDAVVAAVQRISELPQ